MRRRSGLRVRPQMAPVAHKLPYDKRELLTDGRVSPGEELRLLKETANVEDGPREVVDRATMRFVQTIIPAVRESAINAPHWVMKKLSVSRWTTAWAKRDWTRSQWLS
jgi:hypothetical protein